ncbi:MAG: phospho-sugar mutase [Acidimicrobiia bacterium]|nr:phospho-sugar mutase [Acidimicrobiia bacterium]
MDNSSDLISKAQEWIAGDPDPATRAELQDLVDRGDLDEIADRMAGTLEFGTAGLRGKVEAGSNRMNRAVVIRATWGLARHVLETSGTDRGPVVVGRDARLSSPRLLEDTVGVLVAAGLAVTVIDGPAPTPVVAFLAKETGAVAAVIITASHNPPADNGYKAYASKAVQIVPPDDTSIAGWIDQAPAAVDVPLVEDPLSHPLATVVGSEVFDSYMSAVLEAVPARESGGDLEIVYSAMHGVGGDTLTALFARAGFHRLVPVPDQFDPDGRFPTVAFPNPEEPGAMDLSNSLAAEIDADLVIANDPDADRLAVSLPIDGGWRQLSGNQIGVLLADFLLEYTDSTDPLVIQSIVSSPMLASVARAHGAKYDRTLTGFKWICNAALDRAEAGDGEFVFGYEEALGYSVGRTVRDKDGISAALAFSVMASQAQSAGGTVWDRLGALYARHGLWVSTQKSVVREGAAGAEEIAAAMVRLADHHPDSLAGIDVTAVNDYRTGAETRPRWLGATALVEFVLGDSGRALIRPSGTEPKIKIYVDLRGDAGNDWMAAEEGLLETAAAVASDLAGFSGF